MPTLNTQFAGPKKPLGSGLNFLPIEGMFNEAYGVGVLSGGTLYAITMTNMGDGYTAAPTVVVTATDGGSSAAGTAVLGNGRVASVPVSDAGYGYVTPPAVTFSGGAGSGAAGVGILGPNGSIVGVLITNRGSGYTSVPTAAIAAAPSGGSNATLGTVVCAFQVTSVTITNAGSGYTGNPLISFSDLPLLAVLSCPFDSIKSFSVDTIGTYAAGETLRWLSPSFLQPANNQPQQISGMTPPPCGLAGTGTIILQRVASSAYTVNLRYCLNLFGY